MGNEKQTVEVSKDVLAQFLADVSKVRAAFIVCAPRFAGGSFGEQAVVAAHQLVAKEAALAEILKGGAK